MKTVEKLHPKYVVDSTGSHREVILPLGEYEELLEDIADLACLAERADEPSTPHHLVVAELKADGYLSRDL